VQHIRNFDDFKKSPLLIISISIISLVVLMIVVLVAMPTRNPKKLYQKGMDYFINGEYEESFRFFKKAADRLHADSQYQLGLMYYQGKVFL
jgi:hypothetical protein